MVRPDRAAAPMRGGSCCTELAGASPAAVSAGAPRSRPRASGETPPPEWGVKSPACVVRRAGGERVRRPSVERTLQPRDMNTRKGGPAEPIISRRRQQTAPVPDRSGAGHPRGREEGMWTQFGAEQERPVPAAGEGAGASGRGPTRRPGPTSGEGGPYKPSVKGDRAGRESEGPIVPTGRRSLPATPAEKAGRGKGPCFGHGRGRR
jgi:hypothetical protein